MRRALLVVALALANAALLYWTATASADAARPGQPSSFRPDLVGYTAATRATGHPVLCATRERSWVALAARWNSPDAIGFWDPPFILVDRFTCDDLRHWRTADADNVGLAIFVLGHEAGHADQLAEGKPYDERDADCRGARKWHRNTRALGIRRRIPGPSVDLGSEVC